MKKLLIGAVSAAALTLALQGLAAADPAVRIDDVGCAGFVPTATGGFGTGLFSTDPNHAILTSSGIQKLVCHFDIPAGSEPDKATHGCASNSISPMRI